MTLHKDQFGIIHQGTGLCEECEQPGRYVRAVRVSWGTRSLGIYACELHREGVDRITAE
ncbi:hypothetical protein ABZ905_36725 [Streptomyces parvus]|uniref:hypothetical protein n=1 Tax=Streptomyces parvus TaxID=66428 RepID=UPI0033E6E8C2